MDLLELVAVRNEDGILGSNEATEVGIKVETPGVRSSL